MLDASALDENLTSLDDSKQEKLVRLQAEACRLLDLAMSPTRRRRALDECIKVVREMNRVESEILHLRTVEEAYKDLAAGRLR